MNKIVYGVKDGIYYETGLTVYGYTYDDIENNFKNLLKKQEEAQKQTIIYKYEELKPAFYIPDMKFEMISPNSLAELGWELKKITKDMTPLQS